VERGAGRTGGGHRPAALPQRPNLHWLGPQPADRLPHLLAGWDLCLLPFVHDESTRYLNPSQTLEYMAADKPVVSSAIRDVLWLYGDAVAVAPTAQDFVPLCAQVLAESASARGLRSLEMISLVFMYSWDRSADSVHKLMAQALSRAQVGTGTVAPAGGALAAQR
jgi:glycosyltransferase involved in cell wall biosynthesis